MEVIFLLVLLIGPGAITYFSVRKLSDGMGCLALPLVALAWSIYRLYETRCEPPEMRGCGMEAASCTFMFIFMVCIVVSMLVAILVRCKQGARRVSEQGTGLNPGDRLP